MDFIIGSPRTCIQLHESIWVIMDRVPKSSHFLAVKTTDSPNDYAMIYSSDILNLHGISLYISSDRGPHITSYS